MSTLCVCLLDAKLNQIEFLLYKSTIISLTSVLYEHLVHTIKRLGDYHATHRTQQEASQHEQIVFLLPCPHQAT